MDVSRLCPHCMRELQSEANFCPYCGKNIKDVSAGLHQLNPFTILQGKYLVGSVLGEGGFGITYIGIDMNLEVRVAIKEFYPNGYVSRDHTQTTIVTQFNNSNAEAVRKWKEGFVKEARALGKCQNLPGIVGVKDFFEENGTAYIVMEYVDGTTLKTYVKEKGGKIEVNQLLPAIRPVMSSLQQVHDTGVIHRDISPDNIMFMPDGSMKLLDFGAARSFAEADAQKSLSVMLKPGFAPEEQYRTHGNQGPWSDVYALAATIYRCITGTVPVESMERMRNDTLKSPKDLGIRISDQENAALMKAMAVYAEDRFQSVRDFEKALYEGAPVTAPTPVKKKEHTLTGAAATAGTAPAQAAAPAGDNKSRVPLFIGIGAIAAVLVVALVVKTMTGGLGIGVPSGDNSGGDTTAIEVGDKSPDGNDSKDEPAPTETAEGAASWNQSYSQVLGSYHGSNGAVFTLTDINSDDIPEMIIADGKNIDIVTTSASGATDMKSFDNVVCAVDERAGNVYISQAKGDTAYDYVYTIENGVWKEDQNGKIVVGFDAYFEPSFDYYMDDRSVQSQNYSSWADELYRKANSLSSYSFIKVSSKGSIDSIKDMSDMSYYSDASYSTEAYYENYGFNRSVQIFVAPDTGYYYFELKGGAGGADGDRVLDGSAPYDGDGAVLEGSMDLTVGDKVYIMVGGAGDVTSKQRGIMAGGFNGGGDSFWSGGGGGCTDIYYKDRRVAAAAGGGGGNYDYRGEPGRESFYSGKNVTYAKNGEGTGHTMDDGSGAGGGGGWYGGTSGGHDQAGHGGVNGFDGNYFLSGYENSGGYAQGVQNVDGYAKVYR